MRRLLLILLLCLSAGADEAYVGATLHPVSGPPVQTALVVRDGRIVGLSAPPAGAEVVSLQGLHVYPAMIDADSALGLVEIAAVPPAMDISEVGQVNPELRADIAFNPDSKLIEVARSAGVLFAGVAPRGNPLSGQASVMRLIGWTREDMALKAPVGLVVEWPDLALNRSPLAATPLEEQKENRRLAVLRIQEAFANARAYRLSLGQDVKWEAMQSALKGESLVLVRAQRQDQIEAALELARQEKLRLVLVGGADAWRVASKLAERKVPVIYTEMLRLPRDHEAYDLYYRAPAVLAQAGVTVALSLGEDASNTRWLPELAGRARAHGLSSESALKSVTLNAARILGVDDHLGSLEPGKEATFIVTDGDLLEADTHVLRAFVEGREIDLDDFQKELYRRYRNRRKP